MDYLWFGFLWTTFGSVFYGLPLVRFSMDYLWFGFLWTPDLHLTRLCHVK